MDADLGAASIDPERLAGPPGAAERTRFRIGGRPPRRSDVAKIGMQQSVNERAC